MRRNLHFVLFSLLLWICGLRPAAAYSVMLDDKNGLTGNMVTGIEQDTRGMLWVSTDKGLCYYDGFLFRDLPGLKGVRISCMQYDQASDRLWVGCDKGFYYVNLASREVVNCAPYRRTMPVTSIAASNGVAYILFSDGRLMRLKGSAVRYVGPMRHAAYGRLAADAAGDLYFTSGSGLYRYADSTGELTKLGTPDIPLRIENLHNNLLLLNGQAAGMLVYDVKQMRAVYTLRPPAAESAASTGFLRENQLYTGYKKSNTFYTTNLSSHTMLSAPAAAQVLLRHTLITCLYADAAGVTWIGTRRGLIKVYGSESSSFHTLFADSSSPVSMRQIIPLGDRLLMASYKGIFDYNPANGKASMLPVFNGDEAFPLYARSLYADTASGYLYVGTESVSYPFYRYNLKQRRVETNLFKRSGGYQPFDAVYYLLPLGDLLWMATDKGIFTLNLRTLKLKPYLHEQLGADPYYYLYHSADGMLWAAGTSNIAAISPEKNAVRVYSAEEYKQVPGDDFTWLGEDGAGNMWVGTRHSGLLIFSSDRLSMGTLDKTSGLSSNEVYSVLWQDSVTAWISTAGGLCRYNTVSKQFNNYFLEDGLPENEFNQNAAYRTPDGEFYFGGLNGVVIFRPDHINASGPVKLYAAGISIWRDASQAFADILSTAGTGIDIGPSDHQLAFTFGLSDYTEPEASSYFYRIEGLYNDWVALGRQNVLRLEGLAAGSYTLQVKAFNKNGIQALPVLAYPILVHEAFYRHWWFYFAACALLVGVIFLYFRWRIRNIERMQQLRTQISSYLHDEVGSLLTSIIISTDSARYASESVEEKNKKLEKIAALSREATNTMSDVLWSIDARNDRAGNLIDHMREHAEELLLPLDISVSFHFDVDNQEQYVSPDTRQNLFLIFKEATNNIARHSTATQVEVSYSQHRYKLSLTVKNNGADPAAPAGKTGQGLRNMKMRAETIGASINYSREGEWFTVSLKTL